jgi:hypothetical protein
VTITNEDTLSRLVFALGSENAANDVFGLVNALADPVVIDEVVTTTNAVETNLSVTVPAGAVILTVQANLNTAVAGDASGDDLGVKIGIGITATPNKYGLTTGLTKNLKINTIPAHAVLANAEQICVKLAKTDGTACTEKMVAGAKVRVRVTYLRISRVLPDAA